MKTVITSLVLFFSAFFSTYLSAIDTVSDSSKVAQLEFKIAALSLEEDDIHCEVPCGIYGDSLRVALIEEHISTIEKASAKILEESASATPNYNQLIRWVMNKEEHAEKIQHIVSQYFLHQRIKLVDKGSKKKYKKYTKHLASLHSILVYSMKCKQSTDIANIEALKKAVDGFEDAYFHKH